MSKILSTIDYWENFAQKYPDLKPIQAFYAEDPILTKIFNIVAVPNILFSSIDNYPFNEKLSEFSAFSIDEVRHLYRLSLETEEDPKKEKESHWLEYLVNLYELVGTTLRLYKMLKKDATLSQNEIIDFINIHFRYHLAIDKTYIIEDTEGVQTIKRVIGRIDPFQRLIFINNNMLQIHFLLEPIKNEVEEIKNQLDIKSVINFQRYRPFGPVFDEICFAGGRRSNKYQVEFYFKDRMLDEFSYPIRRRFDKLICETLKSIPGVEAVGDIGVDPKSLAEEKLSDKALRYKSSTGVRPAGYLGDYFKNYFEKEYYEILGTTNLPGDPRPQEGAYPYCDEYCKTQKDHEGQLPCKYETSEGYCKDPDKKKPRFKYDIEHSDRGLDEPVDDESETSRQEGLAKPYSDIRSIVTTLLEGPGFENEELELFRMYFTDELTQEDIAKKLKISQSVVSERIKKLEKKIKKAIEDHLPVNFNY